MRVAVQPKRPELRVRGRTVLHHVYLPRSLKPWLRDGLCAHLPGELAQAIGGSEIAPDGGCIARGCVSARIANVRYAWRISSGPAKFERLRHFGCASKCARSSFRPFLAPSLSLPSPRKEAHISLFAIPTDVNVKTKTGIVNCNSAVDEREECDSEMTLRLPPRGSRFINAPRDPICTVERIPTFDGPIPNSRGLCYLSAVYPFTL
ncbi:hypothetical protein B0H14DRAFT_638045 [Mycena olivaceomarginata]|nr:hypothetical protein B0H14DRAFT_638045 [Mycena olivaceomarginata]